MEVLERRIGERLRIGLQLPPECRDRIDDRQASQLTLQRGERCVAELAFVAKAKFSGRAPT